MHFLGLVVIPNIISVVFIGIARLSTMLSHILKLVQNNLTLMQSTKRWGMLLFTLQKIHILSTVLSKFDTLLSDALLYELF